jgi:SAM-dependent methyltransferase
MALRARALPVLEDTQRAFDGVASQYDASNQANEALRAMRARTVEALKTIAAPRGAVLDLGCGPGTDLDALAGAGFVVTAIDSSPAMVAEARRRVARARLEPMVRVCQLGIQELDRLPPQSFDAAYSSLGPLNCVPNLADAARLVAERLKPGGVFVASVIGRICPWEIALFAWRRDWTRLRVRFTRGFAPVPLQGRTVWTRYYTPGGFERTFRAAGFTRVFIRTLGLCVPPPYMESFAGRHAALVRTLQALEDRLAHWPVLRACGDHFLIVMRKT